MMRRKRESPSTRTPVHFTLAEGRTKTSIGQIIRASPKPSQCSVQVKVARVAVRDGDQPEGKEAADSQRTSSDRRPVKNTPSGKLSTVCVKGLKKNP